MSSTVQANIHLIITTHTTRHLETVLAGLARQSVAPRSLVVTCDVDDTAIGEMLHQSVSKLPHVSILWVRREHTGVSREAQVRNNGVRALLDYAAPQESDLLVFLDGDMLLAANAVERYQSLVTEGFEQVLLDRINLSETETAQINAQAILNGATPPAASASERERLAALEEQLQRQVRTRWMPWKARYKPTMLGCHHAVNLDVFRRVNGNDELYRGWGREDMDLSMRVNRLRPRAHTTARLQEIVAYHLWHPSRTPAGGSTNHARFTRRSIPVQAERGLENPTDQPVVQVSVIADPSTGITSSE